MQKEKLNNNITTIFKINKDTPKVAVCLYVNITKNEKKAGIYTLLNRLFLQGTKTRNAQELANELDVNAIELYSEMKYDYIRFRLSCLNEDLKYSLELLSDIFKNSTLELFEKEVIKLKGEIQAEMDSPKTQVLEDYYKKLYSDHLYGHTYLKIMKDIDSITKDDIKEVYEDLLKNSQKTFVVIGDIEIEKTKAILNEYFSDLKNNENSQQEITTPHLEEKVISKLEKNDANQAQIIQGWMFPSLKSEFYPAIVLLNTILGSMGLSSRLFQELREKKGLAYTVRSSYETQEKAASFSVYVGTEPKNINISIQGFKEEIDKLKNIKVSEEELQNAKNNFIGKRQFFTETNMQQALVIGLYESQGLGYDYGKKFIDKIYNITSDEIQEVAQKYFTDKYVLSVIAPQENLSGINN